MKIRLVGGPAGGKVLNVNGGERDIVIRVPKRETRQQEYERHRSSVDFMSYNRKPMVEARYRPCIRPVQVSPLHTAKIHLEHPDGSKFYEFVEGSRRELGY